MELDEAKGGSRLALSRALTLIEKGSSFNSDEDGLVIGVTGPPGVGKSCLVDRIASSIAKQGTKVAILAVDPSSPVSGGALLGDRIRMQSAEISLPGNESRGDWRVVRMLFPYLWEFRWRVAIALIFLVAAKLANVAVPLVMKEIVDALDPIGKVDRPL